YVRSDLGRDLAAFGRIRLDQNGKPGPIEVISARDDAELDAFTVSEDGAVAPPPASSSSTPARPSGFGVGTGIADASTAAPSPATTVDAQTFASTTVEELP